MKLNFGCGSNLLDGWRNLDINRPEPADRVDITKPLPFKDGVAELILAEHVTEHLSQPDGFRFFEECHRILRPGGVLRVCVPHLDRIADVAHCRDLIVGHGHLVLFNESNLITLLQIAGFDTVSVTGRRDCDGHWKTIGLANDDLETLRVEATKK